MSRGAGFLRDRSALLRRAGTLSIFLIIASAIFVLALTPEETLTKTYDDATQTVTLKDGTNTKIADIQLTSELHRLIFGKDDYAAEIKINSPNQLTDFISNMEFYENNKNGKSIAGSFSYKYYDATETSEKIVDDYKEQCEILINGTEFCQNVLIGNHIETITGIWKDLDIANIPSGETIIRMYWNGELSPGEVIEWVPTFSNMRVEEWASFEGAIRMEYQNIIGTSSGASTVNRIGQTFTIGNNGPPEDRIILGVALYGYGGTGLRISIFKANASGSDLPSNFEEDELLFNNMITPPGTAAWFNVTFVQNTTLVNGIKYAIVAEVTGGTFNWEGNAPDTTYTGGTAAYTDLPTPDTWAKLSDKDFAFEVWGAINPAPIINMIFPIAGYNSSLSSITFNYSAEDDNEIANVTLFIDDIENTTTFVGGVNSTNIATIRTGFSEGVHNWFVMASDNTGKTNTSETRTFRVDTIAPTISYGAGTDIDGNNLSIKNIIVNVTAGDSGSGISSIIVRLFNSSNSQISSNSSVTSPMITNFSNLAKGIYKFNATASDFAGNLNSTETRTVTILNSAPTHDAPALTTPLMQNLSTQDLTCTAKNVFDADNDAVTNITAWYKNGQTFNKLYLPFETNTNDYSGNGNNGVFNGGTPNFTTGNVGLGKALNFDGIDDFVNLSRPASLVNLDRNLTVEAWVYSNNNTGQRLIVDNCELFATKGYCLLILNNEFRFHVDGGGTRAIAGGISEGQWHHVVGTYDNENIKLYVDGNLTNTTALAGPVTKSTDEQIAIGHNSDGGINKFDGKIDELRIYNVSLTAEQISNNFALNYNKIVNQETAGGQDWMCQVTPNDGEADGIALNSNNLSVLNAITFNVTDSFDNKTLINGVTISCNTFAFNQSGDTTSPYGPYGFSDGSFVCEFVLTGQFDKTLIFNAESFDNAPIHVGMSEEKSLTVEEHTWLEAINNCINGGNCALYNLLLQVNDTVGNIWENTKPTDQNVVTSENITNRVVNSTANLTINYTVGIPIKAGYSLGTFLPVRIGFWFLDSTNTTCFNQGDKPTGVEDPYCQPLITEVVGPMGGSVNFTVSLRPQLPAGDYSIKRIIDIDPNNVWINYGQGTIGTIRLTESSMFYGIASSVTGNNMPNSESSTETGSTSGGSIDSSSGSGATSADNLDNENDVIKLNNKAGITGAVVGESALSGSLMTVMMTMLLTTFVVFLILISISASRAKRK